MTELQVFIVLIAIILPLDLITVAARVSYLHSSLIEWLSVGSETEGKTQKALKIIERLPRLQASLNLAQNIWRFLLAGGALYFLLTRPASLHPLASAGLLVLASIIVFWLEWIVRGGILLSPHTWALRLLPVANLISFVLWPFVTPILLISGKTQDPLEDTIDVITDQLKTLVDAGQQRGLIEQGEGKMISSIFELSDTLAREIMVPRIDVLSVEVNTPLEDAVDTFLTSGYSRVPVFRENVDHILGLLYAKDLLRVWREGDPSGALQSLLRPAYFVPEAKKINELLAEMQSQRVHMAIIIDEYGGVAGIVTLEDIVEEILGEIQDEYDQGEEMPFERLPNGDTLFMGRIDLDDVNEILGSNLPTDEADTLGGFIYNRIGKVPSVGESVQIDNLLLIVEQVSGRRIGNVRATWLPATTQKDEKIAHADR